MAQYGAKHLDSFSEDALRSILANVDTQAA